MFEIDFFKLIIVAMIGLLVLGPEKLPGLAAKLGRWLGRARSMARQFRMQLEQEVLLEEARQQNKQTIRNPASATPPANPVPASEPRQPQSSLAQSAQGLEHSEPVTHAAESVGQPVNPQSHSSHD
jgi:sec-independent protein translocase protein TatB